MKRISGWSDWHIHPFTFVYLFFACINRTFVEYVAALAIVCFHEFFHYAWAKHYKFDITGVQVLPFGAFLNLSDFGLHHIIEELIVIVAGLSSHLFLYCMIVLSGSDPYLLAVNRLVLLFNILPIYPLDGSKIFLLLTSLILPYKKAIQLQIKVSILSLSILIFHIMEISYIVIYGYLIYCNYQYIKEYRYLLARLYTNRCYQTMYKRIKVNHSYVLYRPYQNVYLIDQSILQEKEVVEKLIEKLYD